jgi:hypothetical protein
MSRATFDGSCSARQPSVTAALWLRLRGHLLLQQSQDSSLGAGSAAQLKSCSFLTTFAATFESVMQTFIQALLDFFRLGAT